MNTVDTKYINKVKEMNISKGLKYNITTMGCSLNENDSEKICGMLEDMGYTPTEEITNANLIIYNTCCVRENAEEKLFGKLGEAKNVKAKNNAIVAICGCMMQEKHIIEKIHKSYPYVDIIFGTHTMHKFPEDLHNVLIKRKKVEDILDIDGEVYEGFPIKRTSATQASVTIMYGCNNFCTYCIVPYVRGRERSRSTEDILGEIEGLAKEGYKEIMLLGQNVNSYPNFSGLLREINKIDGIERIRFISPHPKDFGDDVIAAIKDCNKICKVIHLPLQSGSSNVLKAMNRKYTKEQYLNLVEKMRKEIPNIVFSTDIIVGFPGETEDDFEDTLVVVRKVSFEQAYMYIYSKRVGTPAEKLEQVPDEVKHARFDRLKELADSQVQANNKKYVNTIQKVLVEGFSKNDDSVLTGRTGQNKIVIFEGNQDLIGKIININIISEHKWFLKGEI